MGKLIPGVKKRPGMRMNTYKDNILWKIVTKVTAHKHQGLTNQIFLSCLIIGG